MLEAIKRLRSKLDISIPEARSFLQKYGEDGDRAFEEALAQRLQPIIEKTGCGSEEARNAYFGCNQDCGRAVMQLLYHQSPSKFEEENRPKFDDFVEAMGSFESPFQIYDLFDFCEAVHVTSAEETKGFPPSLATLSAILTFFSYYHTDTSALLEMEGSIHVLIQSALTTVGFGDLASRFAEDLSVGHQIGENFDYFSKKNEEFFESVREYCLSNARELFDWGLGSTARS